MLLSNDMCMRKENRKEHKHFSQKKEQKIKEYSHQATQREREFIC